MSIISQLVGTLSFNPCLANFFNIFLILMVQQGCKYEPLSRSVSVFQLSWLINISLIPWVPYFLDLGIWGLYLSPICFPYFDHISSLLRLLLCDQHVHLEDEDKCHFIMIHSNFSRVSNNLALSHLCNMLIGLV